jgi:hypothetical protein
MSSLCHRGTGCMRAPSGLARDSGAGWYGPHRANSGCRIDTGKQPSSSGLLNDQKDTQCKKRFLSGGPGDGHAAQSLRPSMYRKRGPGTPISYLVVMRYVLCLLILVLLVGCGGSNTMSGVASGLAGSVRVEEVFGRAILDSPAVDAAAEITDLANQSLGFFLAHHVSENGLPWTLFPF